MNLNKYKKLFLLTCLLMTSLASAESIGVVSGSKCVNDSKLGKTEQASFENLKKQMGGYLDKTGKDLNELASKLNDAEYMDGLSPEAEIELKEKVRSLNEEMSHYQNQSYQILNQVSSRSSQKIGVQISLASEAVAKEKKLDVVLNQDSSCFYRNPSLDITDAVIVKMDELFDKEAKELSAQTPVSPETAQTTQE